LLKNLKYNPNVRQKSVRKKTASRICAIQVLYSSMLKKCSIQDSIEDYFCLYQNYILTQLEIKTIHLELFHDILSNIEINLELIDNFISNNLSDKWKIERLSLIELCIFRLSIYELCISQKFDRKTIINEYISMFEIFYGDVSFANAFLDNISKKKIN
tara:strand:- start:5760 stop:6233 length:474 start_codon:yes stop_codon:yes gene_type:complete